VTRIAIIPARGGSKRIPKKNIKSFLGKPIIAYTIEAALQSQLFDKVIVSTDNEEIAIIARFYGAEVPVLRSNKNSDDHAVLADVILEVLLFYKNKKITFDKICCLLPTAPFVTYKSLKTSYNKLKNEKLDAVFPVLEFSFPIQRSFEVLENKIHMVWEEYMNSRSQDLAKRYHDAGQYYWLKTTSFLEEKKLFMKNSGAIIISELEAQDIDTETDWKLAELKYKLLQDE
jgi:pseudaminic acid cytidylyltransferase